MTALPTTSARRRGYLDWLRGLAVLVMIEAHILDSWTRLDERSTPQFGASMILGGFGAPLFLFLAGVAVALSAGSKFRRSGDPTAASTAVMRRGFQIFLLAFLFRLQAMVLSWGSWMSLLKVDILNIMGPAIMAAAWLWGVARTPRGRILAFLAATLAIAFLTPPVRAVPWLGALPDPIEGYLRPRPGFTNFAVFPWAAFVFAGAVIGVLIDRTRTGAAEARLNVFLGVAGLGLAAGSYAASYFPSPYEQSNFWTSSPAFFLLRTGLLVAAVSAAYAWGQRKWRISAFSPLEQMGRTSLFIYWIHIELIYGLMVRPLHKSMTLGQAWLGVAIFGLVMLLLSLLKDRLVALKRRTTNSELRTLTSS
ncbi:MAG TPA: acyltransferase family protein [Vicinamibacterales bacterium]